MDQDLKFIQLFSRPGRYFKLTFLLSWILWIPLVLLRLGGGSLQLSDSAYTLLSFLGVLMPAVAALTLTARDGEIHFLLVRLTLWRVHWKWWAAAVLVQPGLLFLTSLIYALLYAKAPVELVRQPSAGAMAVNMIFLLLATLGEEIGWRGVALPALELKHNALKASLLLGIIYVAWHTPYWLIVGKLDRAGLFYTLLNGFFAFAMTIYVTWFFNRSRFSILLPVAFHVTFNIVNGSIFPLTSNVTAYGILIVLEWIIALLLIPVLRSEQITSREKSV
jgi:membrane protease YdiL (CAAX protease family)